jgi:DNA-damage-inducible protein J
MQSEQVNFRIDPILKSSAEAVFSQIGLTATDAIRLFYTQVVLRQGLPFDVTSTSSDTMQRFEEKLDSFIEEHRAALERLAQL